MAFAFAWLQRDKARFPSQNKVAQLFFEQRCWNFDEIGFYHFGFSDCRDGLHDEIAGTDGFAERVSGRSKRGIAAAAGLAIASGQRHDCRAGAKSAGAVGRGIDAGAGAGDGELPRFAPAETNHHHARWRKRDP